MISLLGIFLAISALPSCSGWSKKAVPEPLTLKIEEYYGAEKNHDWERTYQMRTPSFRRVVPRERYFREMEEDTRGWGFIAYSIIGGRQLENLVFVKIRFTERTPPQGDLPEGALIESVEITIWKKFDDAWLCISPGTRHHIRLNSELVYERE